MGHIQMGTNGSLMQKENRRPERKTWDSVLTRQRAQKSNSLTTVNILGKGFMNKADPKADAQFSTREKVHMSFPKKKI